MYKKIIKGAKLFLDYYVFPILSDETFLKLYYRLLVGRKLDLENPKGYNEKLQWLKLHDRNPEYSRLVDKFGVKKIVADIIGEEHVVPLVGGPWQSVDDIDIDMLPKKFVLKLSHDCGGVIICRDKDNFEWEKAKKILKKKLKHNYFYRGREWPYKNVSPCIFAEKYIENNGQNALNDYKFMCFDSIPRIMFVVTERDVSLKVDFFDMDFKHLPFARKYPNSHKEISKPESFELMKELAQKLAQNIHHVRVDFYEVDGQIYFGEYTFYPGGGFERFDPYEYDLLLGEMLTIDNNQEG